VFDVTKKDSEFKITLEVWVCINISTYLKIDSIYNNRGIEKKY
jgi:hypothetical protein